MKVKIKVLTSDGLTKWGPGEKNRGYFLVFRNKVVKSLQQCAGANSAPLRFIFLLLRKITS